ncbi:hypothetical protein TNCV_1845351 [Trichonephila clavipes]|nr:hypothetical protein TNCV_1845351 [Trichonephila clavipes]
MGKYELPCSISRKLEEFEDFKRTLKQNLAVHFVKKQEFRFTEKNRRYEAPGKFSITGKIRSFQRPTTYKQTLRSPCHQVRICSKISRQRRERENHAQLMQISAENLQEELDLRHVENRQIKKELEKLIQDYKPEKQRLPTSQ